MNEKIPLSLSVNGQTQQAFVRANDTLLHVLRDEMQLTGTKRGCNQGVCGACTVMVDGKIVVEDHKPLFVNEWELIQKVQEIGENMLARAGLSFPTRWPIV